MRWAACAQGSLWLLGECAEWLPPAPGLRGAGSELPLTHAISGCDGTTGLGSLATAGPSHRHWMLGLQGYHVQLRNPTSHLPSRAEPPWGSQMTGLHVLLQSPTR